MKAAARAAATLAAATASGHRRRLRRGGRSRPKLRMSLTATTTGQPPVGTMITTPAAIEGDTWELPGG